MITAEMKTFFQERTLNHIFRAQKYANLLAAGFKELEILADIIKVHDRSKFVDPEYTPYVYITWSKKCQREGIEFEVPEDIKDQMHEATVYHVLNNKHHPEYWDGNPTDVINKDNRDKPTDRIVDGRKMPIIYLAEMIADWSAMSEEFNEPGPYKWARDFVNVRWEFSEEQVELIYKFIDYLWKDKVNG